jgi:GTP-binding protein Era
VGKSTLLNRLVGEKIAITAPKPQTTRNRIRGIRTAPDYQMVFLDTPGIHQARGALNTAMVRTALAALAGVDVILCVVEAHAPDRKDTEQVLQALRNVGASSLLVVNKVDLVRGESVEGIVESVASRYRFHGAVCISALSGAGTDELLHHLLGLLPPGPVYYPEDTLTDVPERFLCAEIIREKVIHLTSQELPYAVAVTVESFTEETHSGLIHIQADIHVERASQKGIVIGREGAMLRDIGTRARVDMEKLLGARVFLQLWVRVKKNWRKDPRALKEFGYRYP